MIEVIHHHKNYSGYVVHYRLFYNANPNQLKLRKFYREKYNKPEGTILSHKGGRTEITFYDEDRKQVGFSCAKCLEIDMFSRKEGVKVAVEYFTKALDEILAENILKAHSDELRKKGEYLFAPYLNL